MPTLATLDLFSDPAHQARSTHFRGRDRYSLSDKRRCLKINALDELTFHFPLRPEDLTPGSPGSVGTAEICLAAMPEVLDSHAYTRKALNSVLTLTLNGQPIFDGVLHWRSHEETASYWPWFNFTFDAAALRPGINALVLRNRTTRQTLGEFFDPRLLENFSEAEAVRKLATIYLSDVQVVHVAAPPTFPRLAGVPATAVAGRPYVIEVSSGPESLPVRIAGTSGARVTPLGTHFEFGAHRWLYEVTPTAPGTPVRIAFAVAGKTLTAEIPHVYADHGPEELMAMCGAETTYWHNLKPAVIDTFEQCTGTGVRISLDDFLANLHFIPLEKWVPLVEYLVRRRRHLALQRLRVPPYSKIQHEELTKLADMAGPLFAGVTIPEPINAMDTGKEPDLAKRVTTYLEYFRKQMHDLRLPGHKIVTFDSAGPMCGHYYPAGLDVHVAETGPACNVLEEACCRGAATAFGKPWGIAAAMHWYFGQGAHYAYDDARVRLARLTMLSAYLAGARQVLWEGGVFDNLPVYNFILSEESWRDYYRRYDDPRLSAVRSSFRDLVDFHHAQQLHSPRVRFGVVRGNHDPFRGSFDTSSSKFGDMSMARAWSLLSVFLPHVSFGRWGHDHRRPARRWYSATPHGQVDVIPAEAPPEHFTRYELLSLLGWNTMDDALHARLLAFVRGGGRLFLSLPHLTADTMQTLEWKFYRGGDLRELCGVRVSDLGGRIETVDFRTRQFAPHLPPRFTLSPRNPLLPPDYDEHYDVFAQDTAYFGGELELCGAEALGVSQRGEPVLLRHKVGAGEVYLLNTWCHPGRGRLLDLAEGVLRGLVDLCGAPLRVEDPSNTVAWFEYPSDGYTRYFFLNTDWTQGDRASNLVVTLGNDHIPIKAMPAQPVQLASDGTLHVLIDSPAVQITGWQRSGDTWKLATMGDVSSTALRLAGNVAAPATAQVFVNGVAMA